MLENEYRKDNWSKSIAGIKLQNNKNLFNERNKYYKQHCESFNKNIKEDINKYNQFRLEELEYKYKSNEMFKDLRNTLKKFNIPEGVECGEVTDLNIKKPSAGKRLSSRKSKAKPKVKK